MLWAETANAVPRGWWCRRLEVRIARDHHNWRDGQHTLRGLLPACPRAIDLRISLRHQYPPCVRAHRILGLPPQRYPISATLLQIIKTLQGPSLRSLALGWRASTPFSLTSQLLCFPPKLRRDNLRVPRPSVHQLWTFANPAAAAATLTTLSSGNDSTSLLDEDDDEDDEDAESRVDEYGSGHDELNDPNDNPNNDSSALYATTRQVSELALDREEYRIAVEQASWPASSAPTGPAGVFLPNLRILHCSHVVPVLREWRLPVLENISVNAHHDDTPEEMYITLFTALPPYAEPVKHFQFIQTYRRGTVNESWRVAEFFPTLIELSCNARRTMSDSVLSAAHTGLEIIRILRDGHDDQHEMTKIVDNITMHRERGLLPALRVVELSHAQSKDPSFMHV